MRTRGWTSWLALAVLLSTQSPSFGETPQLPKKMTAALNGDWPDLTDAERKKVWWLLEKATVLVRSAIADSREARKSIVALLRLSEDNPGLQTWLFDLVRNPLSAPDFPEILGYAKELALVDGINDVLRYFGKARDKRAIMGALYHLRAAFMLKERKELRALGGGINRMLGLPDDALHADTLIERDGERWIVEIKAMQSSFEDIQKERAEKGLDQILKQSEITKLPGRVIVFNWTDAIRNAANTFAQNNPEFRFGMDHIDHDRKQYTKRIEWEPVEMQKTGRHNGNKTYRNVRR